MKRNFTVKKLIYYQQPTFQNYVISYTPDLSLPKEYWQKLNATCRDSFGKKIDGLPSDNTYTVCVETLQRFADKSAPLNLNECKTIQLDGGKLLYFKSN